MREEDRKKIEENIKKGVVTTVTKKSSSTPSCLTWR